jgi:hypothetical protein
LRDDLHFITNRVLLDELGLLPSMISKTQSTTTTLLSCVGLCVGSGIRGVLIKGCPIYFWLSSPNLNDLEMFRIIIDISHIILTAGSFEYAST